MSIADEAGRGGELGGDLVVAVEHPGKVHQLAERPRFGPGEEGGDIGGGQGRTRGFAGAGWDAGGDGPADMKGQPGHRGAKGLETRDAGDVGDLVRIGHDCAGAMREDGAGELGRPEVAAFDMDVGVDERRGDGHPGDVEQAGGGGGVADAGDHPVDDRDVGAAEFAGQHVEDRPALQQQIGGGVTESDREASSPAIGVERGAHGGNRHGGDSWVGGQRATCCSTKVRTSSSSGMWSRTTSPTSSARAMGMRKVRRTAMPWSASSHIAS